MEKIKCLVCGKEFKRITNTHLRAHSMTMNDYIQMFPDAKIDMDGLADKRVEHLRDKSYEEIYGEERANELKEIRKNDALSQMKDEKQINIRKEKCGYEHTEEQKEKISEEKTVHGGFNYRKRALKHYGCFCQRCSNEFKEEDLVVHHKDLNSIKSDLGNHKIDNLMVLCKSCHGKLHNELSSVSGKFAGISNIEKGMHYILKGLADEFGLDLLDENFIDTPKRVARAYYEIFEGIKDTDKQVNSILSSFFESDNDEMIICSDIQVYSMCPHHFLPVVYDITVAYIPSGKVLGISKLSRLVEILAKRPILQEDLTQQIVNYLNKIDVLGAACKISGEHFCMRMRGVKQRNAVAVTSALTGVFKEKPEARAEFFSAVKK